MMVEIADWNGKCKMSTKHQNCVYPLDVLKETATRRLHLRGIGKQWRSGLEKNTGTRKRTVNW